MPQHPGKLVSKKGRKKASSKKAAPILRPPRTGKVTRRQAVKAVKAALKKQRTR